ncbi:MAG: AAA family ATPase, partial [Cellvibrionaceae bacterium]|nr:AAA family ATPase [Cellvibrionaceae bacterium]
MDSLAEYLEYYGFECEPFVDGVCFFPGAERAEALEQIQHWCDFGAGVIVLEGEPGIGKTCLARQLLEAQPPAQLISELDGSALANLEQMLMVVAAELGVELRECEGGSAMLNQLRQAIKARQHQQQPSLLITVRRAQYLDDACLLALLGLLQGQAPGAAQINVVLFAEPGLSARLRKLDVAEVLINQLSLRPLSGPEVAAYVQQQAHSVAYEGPELFNAAEIKQLQLGSGGVPAEINILAQNLLIDRLYHKPHRASKSMPLPLFVAAAVLGVGALAFLYREQWFGAQPGQPQPATVAQAPTAGPNDVEALVQQALTPAKPVFAGDMQAMPLRVAALAAVALPPADIEWVEGNEPVALPPVSESQSNKPQSM